MSRRAKQRALTVVCMEVNGRRQIFPGVEGRRVARAQVTGRGRDSPGCGRRSVSVRLHPEPKQRRRDVDGSRGSEISAIHYPHRGKLLRGNRPFGWRKPSLGYKSNINVFSFPPGDSDSFSAILLT